MDTYPRNGSGFDYVNQGARGWSGQNFLFDHMIGENQSHRTLDGETIQLWTNDFRIGIAVWHDGNAEPRADIGHGPVFA